MIPPTFVLSGTVATLDIEALQLAMLGYAARDLLTPNRNEFAFISRRISLMVSPAQAKGCRHFKWRPVFPRHFDDARHLDSLIFTGTSLLMVGL